MLEIQQHLPKPSGDAADAITRLFADAAAHRQQVLFFASGGSSLEALPQALPPSMLPESLTITVADERLCTEAESNFKALSKTPFYTNAVMRGAGTIDPTALSDEVPADTAVRFESAIRTWLSRRGSSVRIVALLGLGADGHTAGIFPDASEDFTARYQGQQFAVAHEHPTAPKCPRRLTVTATFLSSMCTDVVMYATGISKDEALSRLLAKDGALSETPGRIVQGIEHASLYTDRPMLY